VTVLTNRPFAAAIDPLLLPCDQSLDGLPADLVAGSVLPETTKCKVGM